MSRKASHVSLAEIYGEFEPKIRRHLSRLVGGTESVMAFRLIATGRGFMCMGGHQQSDRDESAALRREIQALREEIRQLEGPR